MREIKFRAWDKPINRWYSPVYEAYAGRLEELNIGMNGRLSLRKIDGTADESTFKDRFEIMQYTGLKDKNGKEIYEGDIISWADNLEVYEVKWGEGDSYEGGSWIGYAYINSQSAKEFEIIGNIYENPELLNK